MLKLEVVLQAGVEMWYGSRVRHEVLYRVAFQEDRCHSVIIRYVFEQLLLGRIVFGVSSRESFAPRGAEESASGLWMFQLLLLGALGVDLIPACCGQATVLVQRGPCIAVRDCAPGKFIVKMLP